MIVPVLAGQFGSRQQTHTKMTMDLTMNKTAYISHQECHLHDMGEDHPECPQRLYAIEDQLNAAGLFDYMTQIEAPKAEKSQLLRAHPEEYVDRIIDHSPTEGMLQVDPDTLMNPHTLEAALRAAGAGVRAVDALMAGEVNAAFCGVRPPGHHAERVKAMGFCFFSNIAVAALHAVKHHGLERVAIVDFDVHHGNGTEDVVLPHDEILFCSTFQNNFYPHNHRESIAGKRVNVPMMAGSAGPEFRHAVQRRWLPELEAFEPQMIFISAGFDAHVEDAMSGLALREADYTWVTQKLCDIAKRRCQGRIVSILEGGYHLSALGRSAAAHVKVLMQL